MSEIKRLTLISDPTNEFPKNANNSFKVRLPERLSLPGTIIMHLEIAVIDN